MPTDNRNYNGVPSEVVKLRLDSADVMACIDAAQTANVATPGMSLAQIVKWGIVVMAQTLRDSKAIPVRTGFEYSQMTDRYKRPSQAVKTKVGMQMVSEEYNLKTGGRSIGLVQTTTTRSELEERCNGLDVPDKVLMLIPFVFEDISAVTYRMKDHDVNVTRDERAKWLLYADARGVLAERYMTREQIIEAEALIRTVWKEYPSVLSS